METLAQLGIAHRRTLGSEAAFANEGGVDKKG